MIIYSALFTQKVKQNAAEMIASSLHTEFKSLEMVTGAKYSSPQKQNGEKKV